MKHKKRNGVKLDKAEMSDVKQIQGLINTYAKRGIMIQKSLSEIYEHIRDFYVLRNKKNNVIGCGALHINWVDLAEIRSVAVKRNYQGQGYGQRIVNSLIREAKNLGIITVYALTTSPHFFQKVGFEETNKKELPSKIWGECIKCSKFPDECNETAMVHHLQ
jgi:amino-acid N-acetyltransferase